MEYIAGYCDEGDTGEKAVLHFLGKEWSFPCDKWKSFVTQKTLKIKERDGAC